MKYRFPRLEKHLDKLRCLHLRQIVGRYNADTILYIWEPVYEPVIGKCGEDLVCYHMHDQFLHNGIEKERRRLLQAREERILQKADIVFSVSKTICEEKKHIRSDIQVISNGVDFDLFSKAAKVNLEIPEDLKKISRPRIGYIGAIKEKLDFEALNHISECRKDWSIVLVGPEAKDCPDQKYLNGIREAKTRENIHFLGAKNIGELPHYVAGFDVCLMFYRLDTWAYYGSPLKLFEYMASGKPIISADLPAIRGFKPLIKIAGSKEQWVQAIEACLAEDDPLLAACRIEAARKNSWGKKVDLICQAIQRKLG